MNWNTNERLSACLESIRGFPPRTDLEVIVVDNASSDGSAEMVRNRFPEVILIASDRNTGYAKGNNMALEIAKGDWMLTLNPDTEVFEDTLDLAIKVMEDNDRYGALGAQLIGADGKIQRSVRGFPTVLGVLGALTGLDRFFPSGALGSYRLPNFDYQTEQDCDQPMGTFLMFRRSALEQVGEIKRAFDEQFPIFFNEVDLLARLKEAGRHCLYCPDVKVLHHGGESTKQRRKSMIWESHRSLVRYLKKHRPGVITNIVGVIATVGAFVRARGYDAGFRP